MKRIKPLLISLAFLLLLGCRTYNESQLICLKGDYDKDYLETKIPHILFKDTPVPQALKQLIKAWQEQEPGKELPKIIILGYSPCWDGECNCKTNDDVLEMLSEVHNEKITKSCRSIEDSFTMEVYDLPVIEIIKNICELSNYKYERFGYHVIINNKRL